MRIPFSASVALSLTLIGSTTHSQVIDQFFLKNTSGRYAWFEFFQQEGGRWKQPELLIAPRDEARVQLTSSKLHFLRYRSTDGARQDIGWFDFHERLKDRQLATVDFQTLLVEEVQEREIQVVERRPEVRERQYQVAIAKPETRTREITVTKMVHEQQTREVPYIDPKTGERRTRTITYTVTRPVYETQTVEYTVMVPTYETRTQTYTVMVPHTVIKTQQYVVKKSVPRLTLVFENERKVLNPIPTKDEQSTGEIKN